MRTRPDLAERNRARATHGMTNTSTFTIWQTMHARCTNPRATDYALYGGRGVTVCERWNRFENFLQDMGVRPDGKTLDRYPDKTGNYEPGNCRWATPTEQARNRRNNVLITHDNITATAAEWAERTGLERKTIEYRIRSGWDAARAVTTPSTTNRKRSHA